MTLHNDPEPESSSNGNESMPQKRPFRATLLLWTVLILAVWGAVRFFAALRAWDVLTEFGTSLSPLYLSITGAGWGAAGGVLLFGLLTRKKWSFPASIIAVLAWLALYWIERIFFEPYRANLPFALTCSVLAIVILCLMAILPGGKSYFARSEEHEQPVEKSNPA